MDVNRGRRLLLIMTGVLEPVKKIRAVPYGKDWFGICAMLKKWLSFAVKLAISVGLILVLLFQIDLADVPARLASVNPWPIIGAFLLILVQFLVGALRWRSALVAIGASMPLWLLFRLFYIGAFFSQALPSSVGGDAVRILATWRAGLDVRPAFTGVMLERIATVVALVLVVALALPIFISRVDAESAKWWPWAVGLLALGCVAVIGAMMTLNRLPESLRRWGTISALVQVAVDTRLLFLSPLHLARVLAWAVIGHLNIAVAVYALAVALDIEVSVLDCIALVPPVILVTTVPISIAGWGVREGAMVVAFSAVGVSADNAVMLSILYGLVIAITSLPGGVFWLISDARHAPAMTMDPAGRAAAGPGSGALSDRP